MPLEPLGHEIAAARCRELALTLPLAAPLLERWPSFLATELWRLRVELEEGRAYAAMLQFKDVVELLIKFPVLAAARALPSTSKSRTPGASRLSLINSTEATFA